MEEGNKKLVIDWSKPGFHTISTHPFSFLILLELLCGLSFQTTDGVSGP